MEAIFAFSLVICITLFFKLVDWRDDKRKSQAH